MRLWTIFVHHFKRGGAYHFTLANGNDSPLMFPRSYKSVFGSFFFIVVLTNISFKTIHFIIRYTSGMISN